MRPYSLPKNAKTRNNIVDAVTVIKPGQGPTRYLVFFCTAPLALAPSPDNECGTVGNNPSIERITADLNVLKAH